MYKPGLWLLNYVTKVKQYERWYCIIYLCVMRIFTNFLFVSTFFQSLYYSILLAIGIDIQVLYGLRKKFHVQFVKLELCSFWYVMANIFIAYCFLAILIQLGICIDRERWLNLFFHNLFIYILTKESEKGAGSPICIGVYYFLCWNLN